MARIEMDDRLYVEAQELLDAYEVQGIRQGAGEAFRAFGKRAGVPGNPELGMCSEAVAALMGHAKGDYSRLAARVDDRGDELRRIVWTFHRAWIDRYGWAHAMPDADEPS